MGKDRLNVQTDAEWSRTQSLYYNHLFIAVTKFHLLCAVNMIKKKSDSLILLVGAYSNSSIIVSNLRALGFNILVLEDNVIKRNGKKLLTSNLRSKMNIVFCSRRLLQDMRNVHSLFIPFPDNSVVFPIIYYALPNKPKINYIDDGFATCVLEFERPFKQAYDNRKVLNIIYGWRKIKGSCELNVFNTELIISNGKFAKINKVNIKKELSQSFIEGDVPKEYENYQYIYFDQNFDMMWMEFERKSRQKVLEIIKNNSNVLVKSHPSNYKDINDRRIAYILDDNMWECESESINLSGKTLISFWSTAIFTPKILFGLKYRIICLYKIGVNPNLEIFAQIGKFVTNFMKKNEDIEIILPESWEEFERIIGS